MRKLIVLPGHCAGLGGVLISVSMMLKGFEQCGAADRCCLLVQSGSLMEKYMQQTGQEFCLQSIPASNYTQFVHRALQWVNKQPRDYPLLLENCLNRHLLPTIMMATPKLRLSGRPVYYMFRDLARSYNAFGNLGRKLAFSCLSPHILCNSRFTAVNVHTRLGDVKEILYPAVDGSQFNNLPAIEPPPAPLQLILNTGARVLLTPSRFSNPHEFNDKNLRSLPPVVAELKSRGFDYHSVIIGQDYSPNQIRTRELLELAAQLGVADRFTILPPTFAISSYYKYANIVVTLAPREPFGRTVVEAIACGVPVVGSQTGGVGEILSHFAPEWTVDPDNPIAVAEAIVRTVASPHTPHFLAQGKRWVETYCSTESYARRMIEITRLDAQSHSERVLQYSSIKDAAA